MSECNFGIRVFKDSGLCLPSMPMESGGLLGPGSSAEERAGGGREQYERAACASTPCAVMLHAASATMRCQPLMGTRRASVKHLVGYGASWELAQAVRQSHCCIIAGPLMRTSATKLHAAVC
jgi:hypothetical protein